MIDELVYLVISLFNYISSNNINIILFEKRRKYKYQYSNELNDKDC